MQRVLRLVKLGITAQGFACRVCRSSVSLQHAFKRWPESDTKRCLGHDLAQMRALLFTSVITSGIADSMGAVEAAAAAALGLQLPGAPVLAPQLQLGRERGLHTLSPGLHQHSGGSNSLGSRLCF